MYAAERSPCFVRPGKFSVPCAASNENAYGTLPAVGGGKKTSA